MDQSISYPLPDDPGGTPVIRVFPAWPKDINACFSLRAKADFIVTSMRVG